MGTGASAFQEAMAQSSPEELQKAMREMSPETLAKVKQAFTGVKKPTVLFVLGGPGVGKGTQCTKIVENFSSWAHISAGDCLRAERNNPDSKDGEIINNHIKEGKIVPVAITVKLLQKAMAAATGKTFFLIDGYPRNLDNVTGWEENVGDQANVAGVLFYTATEEELEKRLMGRNEGRDDDNVEAIKKRFVTYTSDTMPIVELYKEKGNVISIDGMKSIDEVWEATKNCIKDVESKTSNEGGGMVEFVIFNNGSGGDGILTCSFGGSAPESGTATHGETTYKLEKFKAMRMKSAPGSFFLATNEEGDAITACPVDKSSDNPFIRGSDVAWEGSGQQELAQAMEAPAEVQAGDESMFI